MAKQQDAESAHIIKLLQQAEINDNNAKNNNQA
jgi:hypothetical protein